MKRYCISCGSATEFIDKKPIFCSTCGKSFEKVVPVEVKVIKPVKSDFPSKINKILSTKIEDSDIDDIEDNIDYEDDDNEVTSVPEIDDLQVETQSRPNRGQKLKDIVGTEPNSIREPRSAKAAKSPSKKQVLEDFAKEAGCIRRNSKK